MPKFTGARQEKFEELKVLRRFVGNAVYKVEIAKLEKAEAKAKTAAAAAAAREEARRVA